MTLTMTLTVSGGSMAATVSNVSTEALAVSALAVSTLSVSTVSIESVLSTVSLHSVLSTVASSEASVAATSVLASQT
ncbi:hypothetical protein ZHAS_00012382 [Anopheles sinensis]|uniref:Uncharacterized protein n=1 Tax=Anopheles sinensis TaxID=74873 RepID=A0A084W2R2_ANOSI|nr:hypothetical protein ZHAS_00012382 [Anopheles sinensis]